MKKLLPLFVVAALLLPSMVMAETSAAPAGAMTAVETSKPVAKAKHCNPSKSKPCGNSCIALSKTCHK